jgi:sugar O-acyltransferase (sialic acid O-acetyltransferase NeuD family)
VHSIPPKSKQLVIFGTGEMGSLAKFYFEQDSPYIVCAFTADDEYVTSDRFEGLPLVPFSKARGTFPPGEFEMIVALSYRRMNQTRREKYLAAKESGYGLASYICSRSVTWPDLIAGDNCFILENQTIQPGVSIGSNVMIWSGNHIGHGASIGDHAYVSSHVVLSGHASIGPMCFLGVNATVRDFAKVGEACFIAMGAMVTGDVESGSVVIGPGGTTFPPESRQARSLKRKYFGSHQ